MVSAGIIYGSGSIVRKLNCRRGWISIGGVVSIEGGGTSEYNFRVSDGGRMHFHIR